RLSCIGTSNREPPHGFYDETGARRFWSIHCREDRVTIGGPRQRYFDAYDVNRVWMAVRASDPSPESKISADVAAYMTHVRDVRLRSKSSLESFLADATAREDSANDIRLAVLLRAYHQYCQRTRLSSARLTHDRLADRLRQLGHHVVSHGNRWVLKG